MAESSAGSPSRRTFLKATGAVGTAALVGGYALTKLNDDGTDPAERPAGPTPPASDPVRIGMIGVGARGGDGHMANLTRMDSVRINALCDVNATRAREIRTRYYGGGTGPELYTDGDYDYRRLLERTDVDVVVISTPWRWHTPMAVEAMEAGKHALIEVPAALTVEECWRLVETQEATGQRCMMLENVCYSRTELAVLHLCQQGVLGELTHGEAAYIHELKSKMLDDVGSGSWRPDHWTRSDGNLYPTHGLGPVSQYMGVNRGDAFDFVTSMSSPALGRDLFARETFAPDHPRNQVEYVCGDMNNSLIRTKRGRTILVQFDTSTPRPYSRLNLIQGTRGTFSGFPDKMVLAGPSQSRAWEWSDFDAARYDHPLYTYYAREAERRGLVGHDGADGLMWLRIVDCLQHDLPFDQDVYDAASWSVLVDLSQRSVADRSRPVDFPDFTRGRWRDRPALDFPLPA